MHRRPRDKALFDAQLLVWQSFLHLQQRKIGDQPQAQEPQPVVRPHPTLAIASWRSVAQNEMQLTHINLNFCGIGDIGVLQLATAMAHHHNTVQHLWLCGNGIGIKGAQTLSKMLATEPQHGLQSLLLCDNCISDQGAQAIFEGLCIQGQRIPVERVFYASC